MHLLGHFTHIVCLTSPNANVKVSLGVYHERGIFMPESIFHSPTPTIYTHYKILVYSGISVPLSHAPPSYLPLYLPVSLLMGVYIVINPNHTSPPPLLVHINLPLVTCAAIYLFTQHTPCY